jgi:hypothetical protein
MKACPPLVFPIVLVTSLGGVAQAEDSAPAPSAPATQQPAPTGDEWIEKKPTPPRESASTTAATQSRKQPATLTPDPANLSGKKYGAPKSVASRTASTADAAKDGQWVYTQQYGWIWLPYARKYTYVAPEGYPYSYIYYPGNGWCWLYSPWVFGWGPAPYWGVYGQAHFAWYGHPWFARPQIYPRFRYWGPMRHGGYWGGGFRGHGHWGGGFHGGFRGGFHGRR